MKATTLARLEHHARPFIVQGSPARVIKLYSKNRQKFLEMLDKDGETITSYASPQELARTLWGITFQSPLMIAAGMFKKGECYSLVSPQ